MNVTNAKSTDQRRALLDKAAIALSATCVLHCLAMPVAASMLPLALVWVSEEAFHLLLVVLILPSSLTALWLGCHRHKDLAVLLMGGLGLGTLMAAAFWGHDLFGIVGERLATSTGGVILALGHVRNYLLCRRDNCAHK